MAATEKNTVGGGGGGEYVCESGGGSEFEQTKEPFVSDVSATGLSTQVLWRSAGHVTGTGTQTR